jgi:hypothetical protein
LRPTDFRHDRHEAHVRRTRCTRPESGESVELAVNDDGPGVPLVDPSDSDARFVVTLPSDET